MDAHTNFAYGLIAVAPSPATSGTTLTLAVGVAALMPATPFNATVWPAGASSLASNAEIVRVTNITGDVATIVRAQEGTTARAIVVGDQIAATITAKVITDIENAIPSTAGLLSAINVSAGSTSNAASAFTFANSNGVSFGLDASTITATVRTDYQSAGAYLTTAMQSNAATISNVKVSAGTLSALRSALTFNDSNGVSFGLETNGVLTATVATNYQSSGAYLTTAMQSNAATISNVKISAGTLSALRSALTFGDSNGISFGLETNGVLTGTVATNYQSQGAYLTTAGLSADSSKYVQEWALTGNTAGTTSSAQGSRLYLSGGQGLTISGSSNSLVFSVGSYITTGALSADSSKYAGINGAITGGSITVNTSGVSVNLPAYLTTADLSANSSKYVQEWALTGNTAGTTSSAQGTRLYLSGGQGITISGSSNSLVFSVGSYITTGGLSADSSKYAFTGFTTTTIAGVVVAGTHNTDGLKLAVPGYLTTGGLSADSSKYAATGFTTTTVAGVVVAGTHNTDGLKLAVPGYITTAMLSNAATISNINVSAGTLSNNLSALVFADSNNITWGLSGSTITASAPSPGAGAAITLSAGTTSQTFGSIVFSNSNRVSFALSGSTVTAKHALNFSGGTTSNEISDQLVFSDSNRVSFGLNGSTLTAKHALNFSAGTTSNNVSDQIVFSNSNGYSFGLNGSTITAQGPFAGWLEPYPMTNTALFGPGAGTWYLAPFTAFNSVSGGRINFLMQNTSTAQLFRDFTEASIHSNSTGGQQQGYTYSLAAAIFSQGTGANSTRLESNWSNSFSFGWTRSVSVSSVGIGSVNASVAHTISYLSDIGTDGSYTFTSYTNSTSSSFGQTTGATNFADTAFSSGRNLVSGSVVYPVGLNTTLSAGAYWLGFAWSSTRSNASTGTRISTALDFSQSSIVGISRLELNSLYRAWGSTATTARSHQIPYGLYTAAANMAPPSAIAFSSDLSSIASQWVPYFNIQFRGLTK